MDTDKQPDFNVIEVEENQDGSADIIVSSGKFVYVFGGLKVPDPTQSGFIDVDYELSVAELRSDGSYAWLDKGAIDSNHEEAAGLILESVIGEDE